MNPQLTFDLNFSFFKSIFSSNNEEEERKKKEIKDRKEKEKKIEKLKTDEKKNISKKDSTKSSETAYTEEESNNISKKAGKIETKTKEEKNEEKNIINFQKEENKKEEEKNIIKEEIKKDKITKRKKNKNKKEKKSKDELLNFLVYYIKNIFLFKKRVKNVIKRHKENFAIISSLNKNHLSMNIKINEEKINKVKPIYESVLKENIFYISRKMYKKKNLLKFSFVNKKNESILDPKFNTEYDEGEFINVINLKKIKDKEEENEEDFQSFLESYYTMKPSLSKEVVEQNKLSLGVVRVKKKHKTMDAKGGLNLGIHKFQSNSILKQRPIKRITSNKKISFADKNETIAYIKDD
jgi:hypothetical protein